LGERLLCKQEVTGSIPVSSTNFWLISAISNRHSASECRMLSAEKHSSRAAQAAAAKPGETIFDN
jgi:hypothetical protein